MATNNFKCEKTGKEFHIPRHRSFQTQLGWVYKDPYGKVLTNPDSGEVLVPIKRKGPIEAPMFLPSTNQRMSRNQKHFKKRAKDHANSDEEKDRKAKRLKHEINSVKNRTE